MRNKIGILTKERGYIERLVSYLQKKHGEEIMLYFAQETEALKEQVSLDNLQLLLVEKEPVFEKETADFPRTVYLTQQQEVDSEREICKYQRAEDVYRAMLKWIQFFNNEKTEGLKNGQEFIYECKDSQTVDMAAMEMIASVGEKLGLLLPKVEGKYIFYDTTGCIKLEHFLETLQETAQRWRLAGQLCSLLYEMEEYLLNPGCLLLKSTHIYCEEKTGQLRFIYIPVTDEKKVEMDVLEQSVLMILQQKKHIQQVQAQDPGTCVFHNLQQAAEESRERILRRKAGETSVLIETQAPHLIRIKNQEKIDIHGNIFKIGKDKKYVDYCISDNPAISKSHADIIKKGNAYFLVDHHSLNATMLNGRKIPPKELMPLHIGDKIVLANEQFDFC